MAKSSARAEEKVFSDLTKLIDETNYKPNDAERNTIVQCSADIVNRAIKYGGGLALAGYAIARAVSMPVAGVKPLRNIRAGRAICFMAGGYVGTRIAMQGVGEKFLGHILELDTPIGREAEVLLREAAPGSPLLALRPVTDSGMSAQPRLRDVAAMQQSGNRAQGAEKAGGADHHGRQSGMWGSDSSHPKTVDLPQADGMTPRRQPSYASESQASVQRWESPAGQLTEHPGQQPDAFSGLGSTDFVSLPGDDSNDNSSSSTLPDDDRWGQPQQDSFQPTGLDTVRRPGNRLHRGFGSTAAPDGHRSRWD